MDSISNLISIFKTFPGLGQKSARKIVFHLLRKNPDELQAIGNAIAALRKNLHPCSICGNITEKDPCNICSNPIRDRKILCVVENIETLTVFEDAGIFDGVYHVLGDVKSGEYSRENALDSLFKHIQDLKPEELIIATSPVMEGDMIFYTILDALKNSEIRPRKISRLAKGIPVGVSIEVADRATLHSALDSRFQIDIT